MPDAALLQEYDGVRRRITQLVHDAADRLGDTVPGTPAWTVRDLVGHLAGLAEDWVSGDLDGYGSDAWAQAQVDRLADDSIRETLGRWESAVRRFGSLPDAPGLGDPAQWALFDAAVHEADLRAVLAPGTTLPDAVLTQATDTGFRMWRRALRDAGAPPLTVDLTDGDRLESGDEPGLVLRCSRHELLRLCFGRRSEAQVRALEWSDDPDAVLAAGLYGPFSWSPTDVVEPSVA